MTDVEEKVVLSSEVKDKAETKDDTSFPAVVKESEFYRRFDKYSTEIGVLLIIFLVLLIILAFSCNCDPIALFSLVVTIGIFILAFIYPLQTIALGIIFIALILAREKNVRY